jgi:hypothetical protein
MSQACEFRHKYKLIVLVHAKFVFRMRLTKVGCSRASRFSEYVDLWNGGQ